MRLMYYTAYTCFYLAVGSVVLAFMVQSPLPLIAMPALILIGLGFLGGQKILEVLSDILKEVKQASSDLTK